MTTGTKPEMKLIRQGEKLKLYRITAEAGMEMPAHHSTMEVALIVQQGEAVIKIEAEDFTVKADEQIIIPAGKIHSLSIKSDFVAIAVMGKIADIQFEKDISTL